MLMPFRRRETTKDAPLPSVGEDVRVYAIGDIHGRDDLLGDLVDRGPGSAQVVERAMELAQSGGNVRFLKGNHEEMFIAAARGGAQAARFFRRIGGIETLASYGLKPDESNAMGDEALARWMLAHIPRDHVDFLDDFEDCLTMGDYLFVHAGVRPKVKLEAQRPADLRWIKGDFLNHGRRFDKMIVHGHNISEAVDIRPNRIGIDTGAYRSGRLTAIGLEKDRRWFLQTGA